MDGSRTLGNACCCRARDPRTETSIDYYTFLGEILCPSKLGNRTMAVVRGSRTLRNACANPFATASLLAGIQPTGYFASSLAFRLLRTLGHSLAMME